MISTFVLLAIVGGVCRLALNWVLRRKLGVFLGLPPILALAFVVLTGPLAGEYGEPEIELITAVIPQETTNDR